MKQYKDLNLRKIRKELDLHFAHFTYRKGQCSCCYGPLDQPSIYWKNRQIPVQITKDNDIRYLLNDVELKEHQIKFILFKNASNGNGPVKKSDIINNNTCISWSLYNDDKSINMDLLEKVCSSLMLQLDEDYIIGVPENNIHTITIFVSSGIGNDVRGYSKFITLRNNQVVEYNVVGVTE